ncbi:MAG TPA: hypothetical protein VJ351_13890, partial [Streptosporangiaceae bacterium]|nr:hypothetical protein [Streptosporangiaceae bacterium]
MPIERRDFFLLVGAATVGAGLAGCTSTRQADEPSGSSHPGSSSAPSPTASPRGDASRKPSAQLGPQVVHGPRDRPQVALTFHGQGPLSMAEA